VSAADLLGKFEASVWQATATTGGDGKPCQLLDPARVDEIVAAARDYGKALVRLSQGPKPPAPRKPPGVHYAPDGDRAACIPFDLSGRAGFGRALTANPSLVTCGHCRKRPEWQEASGLDALAGLERYVAGGAP
jgi:hypothetical protein